MKKFANPAHEVFARNLALGLTKVEAYVRAFPNCKRTSARASASALSRDPDIMALVEEISEEGLDFALERMDVLRTRVVKRWEAIAFSDIAECLDKEGNLRDLDEVRDDNPEALASITGLSVSSSTDTEGNTRTSARVSRESPMKALEALSKLCGLAGGMEEHIEGLMKYGLIIERNERGEYTIRKER